MNIGLGGGSVDMFLHLLKPAWKIDVYELDPLVAKLAHRWFGVVDDNTRRTIVKDGLVAVQEAIQRSELF
jgi:spermidine synthase